MINDLIKSIDKKIEQLEQWNNQNLSKKSELEQFKI